MGTADRCGCCGILLLFLPAFHLPNEIKMKVTLKISVEDAEVLRRILAALPGNPLPKPKIDDFKIAQAKVTLKSLGWSYRRVSPKLGVTYQHLSEVLNGRRSSRRLLRAIQNLPVAKREAK